MKKSLKGALAATAGAVLLLGGAGSLAYWNTAQSGGGDTINSGQLLLSDMDCDPGAGTGPVWTINDTTTVFDVATDKIVPGDKLTEVCTATITATGSNLAASISATGADDEDGNELETAITPTANFKVAGQSVTTITDDNDGDTLTATIELDFPLGGSAVDNGSQNKTETLSDYTVTITQDHAVL